MYRIDLLLKEVEIELIRATILHGHMNSAHEALGVILEEYKEFEEEVFKKASERNPAHMREELIQLAAMCLKTIRDVCPEDIRDLPKQVPHDEGAF